MKEYAKKLYGIPGNIGIKDWKIMLNVLIHSSFLMV